MRHCDGIERRWNLDSRSGPSRELCLGIVEWVRHQAHDAVLGTDVGDADAGRMGQWFGSEFEPAIGAGGAAPGDIVAH